MAEFIEKTDTLNEGREKINAAIQDAEDAKTDARQAVNVSEQAKQIAQTAENKADNVQEQFNQVVIEGDSSVEAAQARVDAEGKSFPTLKARLDEKETQFSSQLAQTTKKIDNIHADVTEFGVIGDGTTDDTIAMQNARDYAITNNITLFIPDGLNVNLPDSFSLKGVRYLQVNGTITCPEIKIGYNSAQPFQSRYYLRRVKGTVKIVGLKSGMTTIQNADKVLLYANGDDVTESSIAYSIFNFGYISELELFSEGSKSGWINENIFIGGRINSIKIDGNYNHNGNVWYSPQFDDVTFDIITGHSNVFRDCRFEGSANITFGEGTHDNLFEKKYYPYMGSNFTGGRSNINITDNGFNNHVHENFESYHTTETIYTMTAETKNYDTDVITPNENGFLQPKAWNTLFETDYIEITDDFAISFRSDGRSFRGYLEVFDENKVKVEEPYNTGISPIYTKGSDGTYQMTTNQRGGVIAINNAGHGKYVKFRVSTGNSPEPFSFLVVKIKYPKKQEARTFVPIPKIYTKLRGKNAPTEGKYEVGDTVYNTTPSAGGYLGWVCVESGTPGTWRGFGLIET